MTSGYEGNPNGSGTQGAFPTPDQLAFQQRVIESYAERIVENVIRRLENHPQDANLINADAYLRHAANRWAQKEYDRRQGQSSYESVEMLTLADRLLRPRLGIQYRIQGLMLADDITTIAARYKVGKTTLLLNRVKSYVDGTPFLGVYETTPVQGNVVIFNYEVNSDQFDAWLDRVGIVHKEKVIPVNLKGAGHYLQDEAGRDWATEMLRGLDAEVWEIDPVQAAIRGSVSKDEVASEWIAAAELVKKNAGVRDLVVTTHTSHLSQADEAGRSSNERSAGSARWMGWGASQWTYTADESGARYLAVEGRMGNEAKGEFEVTFDEPSLTLRSKGHGTSRGEKHANKPWITLLDAYREDPSATYSTTLLKSRMRGAAAAKTSAIEEAVAAGYLERVAGVKGSRGPTGQAYRLTGTGRWVLQTETPKTGVSTGVSGV